MNILITGANRGLGKKLSEEFLKEDNKLFLTARNKNTLKELESDKVKTFELDLSSSNSINQFFKNEKELDKMNVIIHCASSFEGSIVESSYDDLNIWSNSYMAALKLSKLASNKLDKNGKLIFIGSIVGNEGHIAKSCVPYSVYKGSLKLLAEGFQKETNKSGVYINLGGFRDEDSEDYLQTDVVVSSIFNIVKNGFSDIQFNLMSKKDEEQYL